jgi:hypothetical protein
VKKAAISIASLALVVTLSACSDSGSDAPATTPPPASELPGDLGAETRPADGEEPSPPPTTSATEDEPVDMLEEAIEEDLNSSEMDELAERVEEVSEVDDLLSELDAIDEELAGIDEILEDL